VHLAEDPMRPSVSIAFATAVLAALPALAAPTTLPGPAFPNYPDAKAVQAACDRGLAGAKTRLQALERHAPDARWNVANDDLGETIEDVSGPMYVM